MGLALSAQRVNTRKIEPAIRVMAVGPIISHSRNASAMRVKIYTGMVRPVRHASTLSTGIFQIPPATIVQTSKSMILMIECASTARMRIPSSMASSVQYVRTRSTTTIQLTHVSPARSAMSTTKSKWPVYARKTTPFPPRMAVSSATCPTTSISSQHPACLALKTNCSTF